MESGNQICVPNCADLIKAQAKKKKDSNSIYEISNELKCKT
jgi:hypothetical protein